MAQAPVTFTTVEKQAIKDALSNIMSVTARAARAAQDKGLAQVATAYHQQNAQTLALQAKVDQHLPTA